ncbi:hypothetical protein CEUSTIGMA_g9346.t1 [Chlamydomonas eustigma]|uniref:Major facilitator superfamily (MFS) profile domain-containing protein n=1 Tax=Chlamydomonas eustigma TaxID=1157962 RepID=A0A250XFQ9_9CHLO|nr:hypothetical protein CEUSTIGMA_g9346.t1 [Chlamydomonas eustigma]|eukprot:GAX81918.1 hypothetical protein CEUSTIGMA_g9346.t1 [Chlamydomonas eustigma]
MLSSDGSFTSLEEALNLVGTGSFQVMVLLTCGLSNAADAVEILSVGLLGTAAEAELDLTPHRVGILNSCIFLGMFIGGLFWGCLGDAMGRRMSLLLALTLNALFGALSASSHSLASLVAFRMVAGLGVGGSVPIVFSTMSEFCNATSRGKFMALVASFWMVGSLYSASMGWIMITRVGWRPYVLVASLPAWAAALLTLFFMPETPRYLAASGSTLKAAQVLQRMAAFNKRKLPQGFALKPVHHTKEEESQFLASSRSGQSISQRSWTEIKHSWNLLKCLTFEKPLRSYTWPLMVAWIGLCGGWYCTVLWLPKYFEERGAVGGSIYAETFAVSLANLPGNLASLYLTDLLGRRLTTCLCMAGACVCALLFAVAPASGVWPTVAACVFNAVSVGGWNALDTISAELYPTTLRTTGFGLLGATGRISSLVTTYAAGALLAWKLWAPLVLAAGLLAAGSFAMMMLPEPAGRPLQDSTSDCSDSSEVGDDRLAHKRVQDVEDAGVDGSSSTTALLLQQRSTSLSGAGGGRPVGMEDNRSRAET